MGHSQRIQTVVIGAGQAGLSVGYHLAQRGLPFVILEANQRVGDTWRRRWDSLRLFTPARFDGISGMPFPAPPHSFPTKDEMANYLESYARQFGLPVRTGVKVDRLSRQGDRYVVSSGSQRFEADHVVIAMATYQSRRTPAFAVELDPGIAQLHSLDYRNPSQLREGDVLIVGAGNSGSEIALELARAGRKVWMSGRGTGEIPFRINGSAARFLLRPLFRFLFHRVLTTDTAIGRKARPKIVAKGAPLIRVKARDLRAAGVDWVPRTAGVRNGQPVLEGDRVLDVANVIWCTGFHPGFSWIDLPVTMDEHGGPLMHHRGVVASEPGLYFVGLHFLYAMSSTMIHGVSRDAEFIAETVADRVRARAAEEPRVPALLAAG
jgi:putative flavoprotein involved in K+ transport